MFFAIIIVWLLCAYVDVSDARERCLYVCCVAEWMWRCIGLGSSRVATESIQLNINIPFDIFFLFSIECIRCSRCNCPMSIRTGECIHGVVLMGHRQWPKHRGRRHFNIGHASRFDGYVRWSASLKEEDFFFQFSYEYNGIIFCLNHPIELKFLTQVSGSSCSRHAFNI